MMEPTRPRAAARSSIHRTNRVFGGWTKPGCRYKTGRRVAVAFVASDGRPQQFLIKTRQDPSFGRNRSQVHRGQAPECTKYQLCIRWLLLSSLLQDPGGYRPCDRYKGSLPKQNTEVYKWEPENSRSAQPGWILKRIRPPRPQVSWAVVSRIAPTPTASSVASKMRGKLSESGGTEPLSRTFPVSRLLLAL